MAQQKFGGDLPSPAGNTQAAPNYDTSLFNSMRWRNIGPDRGGRSIASAGVVKRPLEYYFGAVGGGLWKTTDGGTSWTPVTDNQIHSSSVGAVAVSESNPDVVYIGMGEACLRGNIMQGDGVYKSVDAGKTWTHLGLTDSQTISRIRIHPTNPDIVYVASFGHPAGPNDERGVYRSKDGGKTWSRVLFRNNHTGAIDLAIDRHHPQVLYAAMWEAYRVSWQMSSGGPGCGLFKSTDGGDTWTEITRNKGLPQGVDGRIGVTISDADSNRVYAIVENENGGVFSSDDAGTTWTKVSEDRRLRQRAFYYTHIFADTKNRDTLYVLNTGFYRSTDGGKTYRTLRPQHGDNHDLWIDPNNPQRMINSNDGGANVSVNGGATWTSEDFPTAQLYHVATTKDFPYQVCGAQQDNSTICVQSQQTRARGSEMYAVGGGESGYIAPSPTNPNVFYAGSQGALITRYDRSNGEVRDIQPYPRFFSGEPSSALKERWQWTFPIVFSPLDAKTLYISSQHLWKTIDDGQSWTQISPDLTRADPRTLGLSGGPITGDMNGPEVFGTIFALAPSRLERGTIWTGSDDGLVFVTRDEGKRWTKITPPGLPDLARVSLIDASPHKPGTAYVAAKNYLQEDRAPYIFRTDDFGKTWTKIVNGIKAGDYVHAVREDPKRPGLLYAGTEHGIYISFDNGEHWQTISLNLPDTQVSDIVVEAHEVVIATHGRSFYVLDDVDVLRQITPETANASLHLYQPREVIRSVNQAAIYYYLKEPAEKVTIEILDVKGQTIRTFTGTRADEQKADARRPDAPAAEESDFGPGPPRTRLTNAGLTRFAWDLRYPGATVFSGMILWSANAGQGPVAVPGSYQVRLTVGSRVETRQFAVKIDPRLAGVSEKDLQEQFDLAMKIRDQTTEANKAVILIRAIKKEAKDRVEKAKDPAITAAADALTKKLAEVEEEIYQVRNQSNQDPLNFPIKLNNRIGALRRSVETGDARPTNASYVVFKELSSELEVQLVRLKAVVNVDLGALNKLLAAKNLESIRTEAK
ncbi:MAG TPA: hypothetical protein VK582_04055 [Pyrinomonadaceae bacterium]|nr:hypothetical protein [Pyrinomonadaceae bacterium]